MNTGQPKNIFMIGHDAYNFEKFRSINNAENYRFHNLISADNAEHADQFLVKELLKELENKLDGFDGPVNAITTYIDFPISLMTPILCKKRGLPAATLESVLKCQHKYWGRILQKEVIPDAIPDFSLINPRAEDPLKGVDIKYPFWLKPVKSVYSYLGSLIENREQFDQAISVINKNIGRIAEPFNEILSLAELPDEIRGIDGYYCIAEQIIGGSQCTLEGYVYNGNVIIHGVVDSIRHEGSSAFFRYDYPSGIPESVKQRMTVIAEKLLTHIGYDNQGFNIEFFWDEEFDQIWLLEVNTRVSQSHSDLFEKVDGSSNHQISVEVALNNDPAFPLRKGRYNYASKFYLKKFEDAVVTKVPSEEEIAAIEREIPGVTIDIKVTEGLRLSEMYNQDSYSYELAWLYIAADEYDTLSLKYQQCIDKMEFLFQSPQIKKVYFNKEYSRA